MGPADTTFRVHRNLDDPIDRFQVLGDRCSGTNFLSHLVERNLPELAQTTELGWKHGFIDRRLAAAPGLLTIVVYRHPIRWIQSVHRNPFEVSQRLQNVPIGQFIRQVWEPAWVKETADGSILEEPIQADMYPHTTKRFENICAMRNTKIQYLEELSDLPCQVVFVNYESANRNQKLFIEMLSSRFNLPPLRSLTPVREYKGIKRRRYRPARYEYLCSADVAFIAAEIDEEQEKSIGYKIDMAEFYDGIRWDDRRRIHAIINPRG